MTPTDMISFHDPDVPNNANIPNFAEAEDWWEALQEWLKLQDKVALIKTDGQPDAEYYLGIGPAERGVYHSCIYDKNGMIFDPHPSRAGLLEVKYYIVLAPSILSYE